MTAENVKNWLMTRDPSLAEHITTRRIGESEQQRIGIYDGIPGEAARICIGGADLTQYREKSISILVQWTEDPEQAAAKAREIYQYFYEWESTEMDGISVISADPGGDIVPVENNSGQYYGYYINIKLTHERN